MRSLILTRGLPGGGKSLAIHQAGLADFTLSADSLRVQTMGTVMMADGRFGIAKEINGIIWPRLYELLEQRMRRGDTTVVDAVHALPTDYERYQQLARKYRYRLACLDFSDVPVEMSDWLNKGREEHRIVPDASMERMKKRLSSSRIPDGIHRIPVTADRSHLRELDTWLRQPVHDLSRYEAVVHIGDLQGCHSVLMDALGSDGLRADTFYVFVGDICDRGIENGRILRWMAENAAGRENVCILRGNHEDHLLGHLRGEEPVSEEFASRTLPDLQLHAIGHRDIARVTDSLEDLLLYNWRGQKVMVTHGGLPTVPDSIWKLSGRQCWNGVGFYDDNVDAAFDRLAPPGWMQVHGHRNASALPVMASERSVNLEDDVEHGGNLRLARLDAAGWTGTKVRNRIFAPLSQRRQRPQEFRPAWIGASGGDQGVLPPAVLDNLRQHQGVVERQSASYPHVSSFAFTKQVFFDKSWDEVTVKARGLFANKESGAIVARSYDKFYTVNENAAMQLEALMERVSFPVHGFLKENGFLGICGYDQETDALFVSSKSNPDSPFATMLGEMLVEKLGYEQMERIGRLLRDWGATATFEVVDPVADPHIVDYKSSRLVLLDIVRNDSTFQRIPYPALTSVSKKFGLDVKQPTVTLRDRAAFEGWYRRMAGDMSNESEGAVFEDANGLMFKTKTPFYAFWKLMRGLKDNILSRRLKGKPMPTEDQRPFLETRGLGFMADQAQAFRTWAIERTDDELRQPIIGLRAQFLHEQRQHHAPAAMGFQR